MNIKGTRSLVTIPLAVVVLGLSGCDYLTVSNPNIVAFGDIDPVNDAAALSQSVQQDFKQVFGDFILNGGWFTGEALSADVNIRGNLMANRDVDEFTDGGDGIVFGFAGLAKGVALGILVSDALTGTEAASSIHAARAALFTGWSFLVMGEFYCQGTVNGGPPLSMDMMLDSAVTRFSGAIDISRSLGTGEANEFLNAGLVGRARANLQLGNTSEAIADASAVEDGFVFDLTYIDDLSNRSRLSNRVWQWTFGQTVISVHPEFRGLNDPRVIVIPPEANGLTPFDAVTEIWAQGKYTSYNDPVRLASRIEADYIAAQAAGSVAQLSLVQERRAANGQPPYGGPTDDASVFVEFMDQYSFDFYMEAKRMIYLRSETGPWAVLRGLQAPGTPYPKPGFSPYTATTCWPLPFKEINNNPHF